MQLWKQNSIKFLSAQTISLFGSSIVQFAIIWQITLQSRSGVMMSVATICGYVPQMLISMFAGVLADRFSRRNLIMWSDGIIAFSTWIVAMAFLTGYQEMWMLYVVLLIRSVGSGIQMPAVNALLPQLVPQEHLLQINSIYSVINSLMMFLSPIISGLLLTIMPLEIAFFLDVITALIGNGIMLLVRVDSQKLNANKKKTMQMMKEGWQYIRHHDMLSKLLLFIFFVMVFISPAAFMTPLLVARNFHGTVYALSISEMMFALGAVVGGVLMSIWGHRQRHITMLLYSTFVYGAFMLVLGMAVNFAVYLGANFLIGICMPCFQTSYQTYLQEHVESFLQGRVFGAVQIINACALPLGTVVFGPLADYIALKWIFCVCALTVMLCVIFLVSYIHRISDKHPRY